MRIVMFGTGPFAVPTFQALLDSDHEVVALVTRPIADSGKRRKSSENPTRDKGEEAQLEIFDPPSINEDAAIEKLQSYEADLFVVCDYGQILSRECLGSSRLGGINLHGSLLPKYRGAAPINWAIYHGDSVLGITVIHMSAFLDAGPCLAKAQLNLLAEDTAETVEPKLAQLGVTPVLESIEKLAAWDGSSSIGEKQDRSLATKAPRLKKTDGLIDWTRTAREIVNHIRAFQPWPGTFANWHAPNKKAPVRLIVPWAEAVTDHESVGSAEVGCVAVSTKTELMIQTGNGLLSIRKIQPAGKRIMEIQDFLRGQQPAVGDSFMSS